MTQEHPITPPSEDHVLKWSDEWFEAKVKHMTREKHLCMQAARWGADQELEACLQWFSAFYCMETWMQKDLEKFRTARRPKPPSLKEQALAELDLLKGDANAHGLGFDAPAIRRALESLPE